MKKIAFLFPGQGSQYIGMGKELYDEYPLVQEIFNEAEEITEKPIKKLCFEGPMNELTKTVNLQPAVTAVNLSVFECLKREGITPTCVAGHSLGEFSALYAAGVISRPDTFRLVNKRGELMDREANKNPGAMLAVIGLDRDTIIETIKEILKGDTNGVLSVANYNAPEQTVITGSVEMINKAKTVFKEKKAKAIPLKVSGAWHSPLMKAAQEDLVKLMDMIEFKKPEVDIFLNPTGKIESNPEKIKEIMKTQICASVYWTDIILNMIEMAITSFVETGPKTVLSGLVKKCMAGNAKDIQILQADNPTAIKNILEVL